MEPLGGGALLQEVCNGGGGDALRFYRLALLAALSAFWLQLRCDQASFLSARQTSQLKAAMYPLGTQSSQLNGHVFLSETIC